MDSCSSTDSRCKGRQDTGDGIRYNSAMMTATVDIRKLGIDLARDPEEGEERKSKDE